MHNVKIQQTFSYFFLVNFNGTLGPRGGNKSGAPGIKITCHSTKQFIGGEDVNDCLTRVTIILNAKVPLHHVHVWYYRLTCFCFFSVNDWQSLVPVWRLRWKSFQLLKISFIFNGWKAIKNKGYFANCILSTHTIIFKLRKNTQKPY